MQEKQCPKLAMNQAVSRRRLTTVRSSSIPGTSLLDLWGEKRHWTGFSASTSVVPCYYHITGAPYTFFYLSTTDWVT